jgi:RNA polymerase sigma-70 factor (ECF subfamily)
MDTTSVSLLERLRDPDDQAAWNRLVEVYTPFLYHWARSMQLQEADADDLVQEVFVVLVRRLSHFVYDPQESFRAWLRTVTQNKWRERQRRAGAQREKDVGVFPDVAGSDVGDKLGADEYRQYVVRRALEVMQGEFQEATWKACWETVVAGRPAATVAAELGLTVGAVRAAKFRVLHRLRQEFEGLLD